jgi:sugar lactone lactonase YvrE
MKKLTALAVLAALAVLGCSSPAGDGGGGGGEGLSAPDAPTITPGDYQLTVSWAAVTGASSYEVWTGTSNDSASAAKYGGNVNGLTVTITELGKTTYYVWIKAKDGEVASAFSPAASGVPFVWVVNTLAGSSTSGSADGTGTGARFYSPEGMAVDSTDNVYVADTINHRIRKFTPEGVVTTLAGSGTSGYAEGTGTEAKFRYPKDVAVDDSAGNVYVADRDNYRIRKIVISTGEVTTLAGSTQGYADGTGTEAKFKDPSGVAVDSAGNVYVADMWNHRIRKITPGGVVTTLAGSTDGYADGTGTEAKFSGPFGVAVDSAGNVYVADQYNHCIRKISPEGVVTTLAGGTEGDVDGTGTAARFSSPYGVAVDSAGNVYVVDQGNHRIRKITPEGVVTTLAGNGPFGYGYADGTGTAAKFDHPQGVAVDSAGIVYVGDSTNNRIRTITRE